MGKYTIDENTLTDIANAIRNKTLEKELLVDTTSNFNSDGMDGPYADISSLIPESKYLVTYNNKQYVCECYVGYTGGYCLGNEVMVWEDMDTGPTDSELHYENTPFFIQRDGADDGGQGIYQWGDWFTLTRDYEYTIKVEKLLSDFKEIPVIDFANEISAIPQKLKFDNPAKVTVNYTTTSPSAVPDEIFMVYGPILNSEGELISFAQDLHENPTFYTLNSSAGGGFWIEAYGFGGGNGTLIDSSDYQGGSRYGNDTFYFPYDSEATITMHMSSYGGW